MLLNCDVGEGSWESLRQQDQTSQSWRKSVLNIHWKDWCWSWNLILWPPDVEELTYWKICWCWERQKAREEGFNREWDSWMVSVTQWTWVCASSGSWWWTGSLVCCSPWGCKESDATEWLNWSAHMGSIGLFAWILEKHFPFHISLSKLWWH